MFSSKECNWGVIIDPSTLKRATGLLSGSIYATVKAPPRRTPGPATVLLEHRVHVRWELP